MELLYKNVIICDTQSGKEIDSVRTNQANQANHDWPSARGPLERDPDLR